MGADRGSDLGLGLGLGLVLVLVTVTVGMEVIVLGGGDSEEGVEELVVVLSMITCASLDLISSEESINCGRETGPNGELCLFFAKGLCCSSTKLYEKEKTKQPLLYE